MSDDVLKTILSESKKQFDALNERFDKLEGRFDGLEGRFDTLEGRFDKQERRLDKLEGRFDKLEGRFDKLENRFDKLENEVSRLRISTEDEFAKVREEMATKKDMDKVLTILDRHTGMLDTDELERLALSKQVDRLQDWAERTAPKVGVPIHYQG